MCIYVCINKTVHKMALNVTVGFMRKVYLFLTGTVFLPGYSYDQKIHFQWFHSVFLSFSIARLIQDNKLTGTYPPPHPLN